MSGRRNKTHFAIVRRKPARERYVQSTDWRELERRYNAWATIAMEEPFKTFMANVDTSRHDIAYYVIEPNDKSQTLVFEPPSKHRGRMSWCYSSSMTSRLIDQRMSFLDGERDFIVVDEEASRKIWNARTKSRRAGLVAGAYNRSFIDVIRQLMFSKSAEYLERKDLSCLVENDGRQYLFFLEDTYTLRMIHVGRYLT